MWKATLNSHGRFYFICGLRKAPGPPLLLSSWKIGRVIVTILTFSSNRNNYNLILVALLESRIWLCFCNFVFKIMTPTIPSAALYIYIIFSDFLAPSAQQLWEQTSCSLTCCQTFSVTVKQAHFIYTSAFPSIVFIWKRRCHRRGSPLTCRISSPQPRLNASPHNAPVLRCQSLCAW